MMINAPAIAKPLRMVQNVYTCKTKQVRFSSLYVSRQTPAAIVCGFFVSARHSTPTGGNGGEGVSPAGYLERQSANPAICRPPRLAAWHGLTNVLGIVMATINVSVRSAHYLPLTEKAARRAARVWFGGSPTLTLAAWRDNKCSEHCARFPKNDLLIKAFNEAFALEIGNLIIGGAK